jgi:hypothetical protein
VLLPNVIILKLLPPTKWIKQLHADLGVTTWAKRRHHYHAYIIIDGPFFDLRLCVRFLLVRGWRLRVRYLRMTLCMSVPLSVSTRTK